MSNDNRLERLWKVQATVNKLVLDGKRDPDEVSRSLQVIIDRKPTTSVEPISKFVLFLDLGTITVPANYNHATWLTKFKKKNHKKFFYYNDSINDQNFARPSTVLAPSRQLRVKVFKQIVTGDTTSEERMAFLKSQNCLFTGAQGASLVYEQKRDHLTKGYWYCSLDEKDNLWEDSDGYHRVPYVNANSDGYFDFYLGNFEYPWNAVHCLLCFCDEN